MTRDAWCAPRRATRGSQQSYSLFTSDESDELSSHEAVTVTSSLAPPLRKWWRLRQLLRHAAEPLRGEAMVDHMRALMDAADDVRRAFHLLLEKVGGFASGSSC